VLASADRTVKWHPTSLQSSDPELTKRKVCIHAPGGAFVLGWDLQECGEAAAGILTESFGATHILHISYRLADRTSPFPAAVQDMLACYHYVLSLGVPPENICLVGDSAGANLVIGLLRYLETADASLPRPGTAMPFILIYLGFPRGACRENYR
jgi:acetyl esterase/lipase